MLVILMAKNLKEFRMQRQSIDYPRALKMMQSKKMKSILRAILRILA
jgi:hypothetical protein